MIRSPAGPSAISVVAIDRHAPGNFRQAANPHFDGSLRITDVYNTQVSGVVCSIGITACIGDANSRARSSTLIPLHWCCRIGYVNHAEAGIIRRHVGVIAPMRLRWPHRNNAIPYFEWASGITDIHDSETGRLSATYAWLPQRILKGHSSRNLPSLSRSTILSDGSGGKNADPQHQHAKLFAHRNLPPFDETR